MHSPKRAKLMSGAEAKEQDTIPSEHTCEFIAVNWEDVYKYNVGSKKLSKMPDLTNGIDHKRGSYIKFQNEIYAISGYGTEDVEKTDLNFSSTWTKVASTIERRADAGVVACKDYIYAVGGTYKEWGVSTDEAERYNPVDDIWKSVQRMNDSRANHALVRDERTGYLYAIGGYNFDLDCLKTMECYDPSENTWTTWPSMKFAREGLAAVAVNGEIYAIGGDDPSITNADDFDPDEYVLPKSVEKYNLRTRRWTEVASLNEDRSRPFAFVFNNKIYVVGGGSEALETLDLSDDESTWKIEAEIEDFCGIRTMIKL